MTFTPLVPKCAAGPSRRASLEWICFNPFSAEHARWSGSAARKGIVAEKAGVGFDEALNDWGESGSQV